MPRSAGINGIELVMSEKQRLAGIVDRRLNIVRWFCLWRGDKVVEITDCFVVLSGIELIVVRLNTARDKIIAYLAVFSVS